jgi:predicted RNA-binding protein with PUA-like domain
MKAKKRTLNRTEEEGVCNTNARLLTEQGQHGDYILGELVFGCKVDGSKGLTTIATNRQTDDGSMGRLSSFRRELGIQ